MKLVLSKVSSDTSTPSSPNLNPSTENSFKLRYTPKFPSTLISQPPPCPLTQSHVLYCFWDLHINKTTGRLRRRLHCLYSCAVVSPPQRHGPKTQRRTTLGESAGASMCRINQRIGFAGLRNGFHVRIAKIGTLIGVLWCFNFPHPLSYPVPSFPRCVMAYSGFDSRILQVDVRFI